MDPLDRLQAIGACLKEVTEEVMRRHGGEPYPGFQEKMTQLSSELSQAQAGLNVQMAAAAKLKEAQAAAQARSDASRQKAETIRELKAKHGPKWVFHKLPPEPTGPDLDAPTIHNLVKSMLIGLQFKPGKRKRTAGPDSDREIWEDWEG